MQGPARSVKASETKIHAARRSGSYWRHPWCSQQSRYACDLESLLSDMENVLDIHPPGYHILAYLMLSSISNSCGRFMQILGSYSVPAFQCYSEAWQYSLWCTPEYHREGTIWNVSWILHMMTSSIFLLHYNSMRPVSLYALKKKLLYR